MTGLGADSPIRAIRYCRGVTRRRARNFYHGLKLLPEPQRSALYVVYAWMRRADDLVDDAQGDAEAARRDIATLRDHTRAALGGTVDVDDPVLIGLRDTAARFPLDVRHFEDMLDGQLDDVAGRTYTTFDDLRTYCERVASSVGLVCISIWGADGDDAPARAIERGIAFQLTNILRDFAEDYDDGRVYLPAADFERSDLTPATLRAWSDPARCTRFLGEQIERAKEYYVRSGPLDDMVHAPCRPTLWAMTSIYHGLLERMRTSPAQVARGPRIRLSALDKGTIVIRARLRGRGVRA
jgi:phytoene synthase